MESVTLYFTNGSSDKVYQAVINESDEGYVVDFAYGRRGSSLKTGTKTKAPVDLDKARSIYQKLVKAKVAKGYTPSESGEVYQNSDKADQISGINCQLLNPIEEDQLMGFYRDDQYVFQQKYDGVRQLIEKTPTAVNGINRKGLYVGLAAKIVQAAENLDCTSCVLDGEGMGNYIRVFDILELNGDDLRGMHYFERYAILKTLVQSSDGNTIRLVKSAWSFDEKHELADFIEVSGGEGLVIKRLIAPYQPGRPVSGGDQLKYKFYSTCSAIVIDANDDRRSVQMGQFDGEGHLQFVGNVTIPPNKPIPEKSAVIEVRYLYAYKGGSIYQPLYLDERTDVDAVECRMTQLKYKQAA